MVNLDNLERPCMEIIIRGQVRQVPVEFSQSDDGARTFLTPCIEKLSKDEFRAFLWNLKLRANQHLQHQSNQKQLPIIKLPMCEPDLKEVFINAKGVIKNDSAA